MSRFNVHKLEILAGFSKFMFDEGVSRTYRAFGHFSEDKQQHSKTSCPLNMRLMMTLDLLNKSRKHPVHPHRLFMKGFKEIKKACLG